MSEDAPEIITAEEAAWLLSTPMDKLNKLPIPRIEDGSDKGCYRREDILAYLFEPIGTDPPEKDTARTTIRWSRNEAHYDLARIADTDIFSLGRTKPKLGMAAVRVTNKALAEIIGMSDADRSRWAEQTLTESSDRLSKGDPSPPTS